MRQLLRNTTVYLKMNHVDQTHQIHQLASDQQLKVVVEVKQEQAVLENYWLIESDSYLQGEKMI